MGADKYTRVFLRNSGNTAWVEVTKFAHLQYSDVLNSTPSMSLDVYADTAAVRNLLLAGTVFRLTNPLSTDGTVAKWHNGQTGDGGAANSREIMTGFLSVAQDTKTNIGSGSVVWHCSGNGLLDRFARIGYNDPSTGSNPSGQSFTTLAASAVVSTDPNSIISRANANFGSNIVNAGTIDAGPTISAFLRQDHAFAALLDICSLGDNTNKFTYYADATPTSASNFLPTLHYLSNTNALFIGTNPLTVPDATRFLTQNTDLVSVDLGDQKDRIVNSVAVQWGGAGSGVSTASTTFPAAGAGTGNTNFIEDATSIGIFGRQQKVLYAPWIQDSATASTYANTVINMFKGQGGAITSASGTQGLPTATAILKKGQIFDVATATSFGAKLGDTIAIRKNSSDSTGIIVGKFLSYSYSQDTSLLTITIGLPNMPFQFASMVARGSRQHFNAARRVLSQASSVQTNPAAINPASASIGFPATSTTINAGAIYQLLGTASTSSISATAFGYFIQVFLNPSIITSPAVCDGPLLFKVFLNTVSSGSVVVGTASFDKADTNFPTLSLPPLNVQWTYPFALTTTAGDTITSITVRCTNGSDDNVTFGTNAVGVFVWLIPQPTITIPAHQHNL